MITTLTLIVYMLSAAAVLTRALFILNDMHKARWRDYVPVALLALGAFGAGVGPLYGAVVSAPGAAYGLCVAIWVWCCRRSACPFMEGGR